MKKSELLLMILQVPLDYLLLLLAAISAYYLRFSDYAVRLKPVAFGLTMHSFFSLASVIALAWLLIFVFIGLYSTNPNRKLLSDLQKVFFGCTTGLAGVALYIMFSQSVFDSRFLAAASWLFAIIYVALGRMIMRGVKSILYRLGWGQRRVILVGNNATAVEMAHSLQGRKELGYKVMASYDSLDPAAKANILKLNADEVIFTNPRVRGAETVKAVDFCLAHHITVKYSADLFDTLSSNIFVYPLAGVPIVELKRTPLDGWGRVFKRGADIAVSFFLIVILAPVMLLIALIIFLETGSPVIYKNERVGQKGRKFFTLKFRSMYREDSTGAQFGKNGKLALAKEAELIKKSNSKNGPIYKIANDPRVTPFGRFIRRWSLDELPQFFNVLCGSMSIVGPRPHQEREVEKYDAFYQRVLAIKPGITGLSQISGRSDLTFAEEMRLDMYYIENWHPWLDLIIFLKTPFVLFKKRKVV